MTDIVARAAAALRRMPPADRDGLARAVLILAEGHPARDIAPEHLPAILEGLAQIERGAYATDDEVEAAYRAFGP